MRRSYRIVRDCYLGYEVQTRSWLWPFWAMPNCNTFSSISADREYARRHAGGLRRFVVENMGKLP